MPLPRAVCLLGPTASGKSGLCLRILSPGLHTIINADSQQVYRDLPVGTGQPAPEEQSVLPHRLYGFVPPGERMSAAEFGTLVMNEIGGAERASRVAVLVGGSGLYLESVLYGLDELPSADAGIRRRLAEEADRSGLGALFERLRSVDPEYASIISANDRVRIFRALELWELAGIRIGSLRKIEKKPRVEALVIGLDLPRDLLYERINLRTTAMLEQDWIGETRRVLDAGFRDWLIGLPAIGYRHIVGHLEGRLTAGRMTELIRRDTRRYAKRQMTWFRKMKNVHWVRWTSVSDDRAVAALLADRGAVPGSG